MLLILCLSRRLQWEFGNPSKPLPNEFHQYGLVLWKKKHSFQVQVLEESLSLDAWENGSFDKAVYNLLEIYLSIFCPKRKALAISILHWTIIGSARSAWPSNYFSVKCANAKCEVGLADSCPLHETYEPWTMCILVTPIGQKVKLRFF